jgi:hypothetical protein
MTGLFAAQAGTTMIVNATEHVIKRQKTNITSAFDSPVGSDTEEDTDMDDYTEEEGQGSTSTNIDGKTGTEITFTRTRGSSDPLVTPDRHGDFAGIQKTMLNPVSGKIIGLKMHVRTRRSRFGGHAFNAIKRATRAHQRGDHVRSIKVTQTTPISVLNAPFSP